jgi:hypothetical protein
LNSENKVVRASGRWFTNIPAKNRLCSRNLKIIPLASIPEKSKRFDDSKTLILDNCYIPCDYEKPFAVSSNAICNGLLDFGYGIAKNKKHDVIMKGVKRFGRVLVRRTDCLADANLLY